VASLIKKMVMVFVTLVLINVGFMWYGQANFEATVKSLGKAFVENNSTLPVAQKLPTPIKHHLEQSGLSENGYRAIVLELDGEYHPKPSKSMKMHTLTLLRPTLDMLSATRLDSNPIVTFNAIETYRSGEATMQILLFGIIPTAELDDKKFARSELARLLAYAIFNPALFQCSCITYEPIDATHTKAKVHDGNITASVTFVTDEKGQIVEIQSDDRMRSVKKKLQPTPWKMRILSYQTIDGLKLPKEVEEVWVIDGENIPYSRYHLTSAQRL